MHRTLSLPGALVCSLLLMSACSHPLPKLAFPDGSNRIPVNPPATSPRAPAPAPAASGAQP